MGRTSRRVATNAHISFRFACKCFTPTSQRFTKHKNVRHPSAFIFVVHRQQQIAIHARMEKGKFSTLAVHIAPSKINGIERGAQYLMQKVKLIGPHSTRWAEGAIAEHGVQGMRIIQGLLSRTRKYESSAIEPKNSTADRLLLSAAGLSGSSVPELRGALSMAKKVTSAFRLRNSGGTSITSARCSWICRIASTGNFSVNG